MLPVVEELRPSLLEAAASTEFALESSLEATLRRRSPSVPRLLRSSALCHPRLFTTHQLLPSTVDLVLHSASYCLLLYLALAWHHHISTVSNLAPAADSAGLFLAPRREASQLLRAQEAHC